MIVALICLLLAVPVSGQVPQVVLSQVRPEVVLIATGADVMLVGSGFGANCGVWVRAADIPEQAVPATVRSSTEVFVRLGSEWTRTPRELQLQVRCTAIVDNAPQTVASEWRSLTVRSLMSGPSGRPAILTPAPPTGLRITVDQRVRIEWTDMSTNELGFHVYVDGQRWTSISSTSPSSTGPMVHEASLGSLAGAVAEPRCGRDIELAVTAFNRNGESTRIATTFRWRDCQ
jgi:hypothetical protein